MICLCICRCPLTTCYTPQYHRPTSRRILSSCLSHCCTTNQPNDRKEKKKTSFDRFKILCQSVIYKWYQNVNYGLGRECESRKTPLEAYITKDKVIFHGGWETVFLHNHQREGNPFVTGQWWDTHNAMTPGYYDYMPDFNFLVNKNMNRYLTILSFVSTHTNTHSVPFEDYRIALVVCSRPVCLLWDWFVCPVGNDNTGSADIGCTVHGTVTAETRLKMMNHIRGHISLW